MQKARYSGGRSVVASVLSKIVIFFLRIYLNKKKKTNLKDLK